VTTFGSDVSHYDAPDTRPMLNDGIVFQTHKAGGDKDDAELGSWWGYVKGERHRALLGAYWVLYPGNPSGRADAFLARLDSQCPGWRDGPFILQVDCEKWNGDPSTVPSVSEVNAFCDRLVSRMPKLCPVGYLPDWVYGDISGFRYPLWSSKYVDGSGHYKALYPGDSSSKWASYGGKDVAILQYSSSATIGNQTTCDANAFRGTLNDLTRLLAPGWAEQGFGEMTTAEVVDGNREYDKPYRQGDSPAGVDWYGNNTGVAVWDKQYMPNPISGAKTQGYVLLRDLATQVMLVKQAVADLAGKDFTDEAAIIEGVLAGLAGADGAVDQIVNAIMNALPADLAQQVVDEMGVRLSATADPNG
jgi:hypothetical protein